MTLDQAGHVVSCIYCDKTVTILNGVKMDFPSDTKHVCPKSGDGNGNP